MENNNQLKNIKNPLLAKDIPIQETQTKLQQKQKQQQKQQQITKSLFIKQRQAIKIIEKLKQFKPQGGIALFDTLKGSINQLTNFIQKLESQQNIQIATQNKNITYKKYKIVYMLISAQYDTISVAKLYQIQPMLDKLNKLSKKYQLYIYFVGLKHKNNSIMLFKKWGQKLNNEQCYRNIDQVMLDQNLQRIYEQITKNERINEENQQQKQTQKNRIISINVQSSQKMQGLKWNNSCIQIQKFINKFSDNDYIRISKFHDYKLNLNTRQQCKMPPIPNQPHPAYKKKTLAKQNEKTYKQQTILQNNIIQINKDDIDNQMICRQSYNAYLQNKKIKQNVVTKTKVNTFKSTCCKAICTIIIIVIVVILWIILYLNGIIVY